MRRENHLLTFIEDMTKGMPYLLWVMAAITNDGAVVFSLVCIYDCIAPGNRSAQSTSAQLRPILTPHALKLTPDRFGPMI